MVAEQAIGEAFAAVLGISVFEAVAGFLVIAFCVWIWKKVTKKV